LDFALKPGLRADGFLVTPSAGKTKTGRDPRAAVRLNVRPLSSGTPQIGDGVFIVPLTTFLPSPSVFGTSKIPWRLTAGAMNSAERCSAANAAARTLGQASQGVRRHLIERTRDRAISISDLNRPRLWVETRPEVPEGEWYRDFGSFKICGSGSHPKTFLLRRQVPKGEPL